MDVRPFMRRYWSSVLLAVTGSVALVAGLTQQVGRETLAGELVFLGVGSLVLSAFAPRIINWEIGPKGVKASMSAHEHDVEESSGYLAGETADRANDTFEEDDMVVAARTALAGEAIAALLDPVKDSPLSGMLLRLFLFDGDENLLVPVRRAGDPPPDESEQFRPGCGATGTAFARAEYIYVDGPAVADATYGLTPAQQEHFRNLTAVASIPITNAAGTVLGVLSASTDTAGGPGKLSSEEAYFDLLGRAMLLSRVLVDLLKWFDDGYSLP